MSSVAAVHILYRAGSSLPYSVMEPAGRYAVFSMHGHIGGMGKRFIVGSFEVALVDVCAVPIPKHISTVWDGYRKDKSCTSLACLFFFDLSNISLFQYFSKCL